MTVDGPITVIEGPIRDRLRSYYEGLNQFSPDRQRLIANTHWNLIKLVFRGNIKAVLYQRNMLLSLIGNNPEAHDIAVSAEAIVIDEFAQIVIASRGNLLENSRDSYRWLINFAMTFAELRASSR